MSGAGTGSVRVPPAGARPRSRDLPAIAALALAILGLVVLAVGLYRASPIVFFGTRREYATVAQGRHVMLVGAGILVVAGILVLLGRHVLRAALVVLPGLLSTWLVYQRHAVAAAVVYLLLVPVALIAAAMASTRRRPLTGSGLRGSPEPRPPREARASGTILLLLLLGLPVGAMVGFVLASGAGVLAGLAAPLVGLLSWRLLRSFGDR